MTLASDSYTRLFDKMSCVISTHGIWIVSEKNVSATFKQLSIENSDVDFDVFDNNLFLKRTNIVDPSVSSVLQNKDCDGLSLVEHNDGRKAIVLVELKSKLTKNNLNDAYQQLIFSLLKAIQLLCLCDDFSLSDYSPIIIIACHGFENAEKRDELLDFANKEYQYMKSNDSCSFFGKCLPSLLIKGECVMSIGAMPFLNDLPLHKSIRDSKLRLILTAGPDSIRESSSFELTL